MKLISCHIDNFGGLHNYNMNFDEGINVVLQDNGWGKTTLAAFLKAMLYGFDSRRSKDITENERKRYLPWQGGKYGGQLVIEAGNRQYRIERTFGETPRFDKVRVIDLKTNTTAKFDEDKLGEALFHLDASAFQRSVFINQNGLSIDGAASSIHTRLNALVSQANDLAVYDEAIAKLTAQIKVYEKTGQRGEIGDITRQIAEKEHTRERLEEAIAEQDSARERITQIDALLAAIREDIEKKKARLEIIAGEAKKHEAARKMLDDLAVQIADLQKDIDETSTALGGTAPETIQIDRVKLQQKDSARYDAQLTDTVRKYDQLNRDYQALVNRYNGELPAAVQLDEIQQIYGELHGIQRSGEETADADAAPEGYEAILTAVTEAPEYPEKLSRIIATETTLQELLRKETEQTAELRHEEESLKDKKRRYDALNAEIEKLQAALAAKSRYAPDVLSSAITSLEDLQRKQQSLTKKMEELDASIAHERENWKGKRQRYAALLDEVIRPEQKVKGHERYREISVQPVITQLEELQKKQQLAELRQNELTGSELTEEENLLIRRFGGEFPDPSEGRAIIDSIREARRLTDDNRGLQARTDGESGKADSIRTALDQLGNIPESAPQAEAPKKPVAGALIGAGVGVAALGAALAILAAPVLAAVAVLGVILTVLGVTGKNNYRRKMSAYEEAQREAQKRNELIARRKDLQDQLECVLAQIADLKKKTEDNTEKINTANAVINSWAGKWLKEQTEVTEDAVQSVLDDAEKAKKAAEKHEEREKKILLIRETTEALLTERAELDAAYPEICEKSFAEALSILRTAQTDYKVAWGQYETAKRNKEKFLLETGAPADAFSAEESPKVSTLTEQKNVLQAEQNEIETGRKQIDEKYSEIIGLSFSEALKALRAAESDYKITAGQVDSAIGNREKFLTEENLFPEMFAKVTSPKIAEITENRKKTETEITRIIESNNIMLDKIGLRISKEKFTEALAQAQKMLNDFWAFSEKKKEKADRRQKRTDQITILETRLTEKLILLNDQYGELAIPERVGRIREDIGLEQELKKKLNTNMEDQQRTKNNKKSTDEAIAQFVESYLHFTQKSEDAIAEIEEKAETYRDLIKAKKQLEAQHDGIVADMKKISFTADSAEEASLRTDVKRQEEQRDDLLMEYQKMGDAIRQADQSLSVYPDILKEIQQLYDQKQKAQNTLSTLKRTMQMIQQAKENLANRYLSRVEQMFNNYLHIWINNEEVRGILDIDFNLQIEENEKVHVAQGYSTGYCDMLDFCMRLALVDTLFESEQPFLILDDPFVNLDEDRLEKALELLNVMAANKQIIYFVCHPVRALEKDADPHSREKFARLAEEIRKTLAERKTVFNGTKGLAKRLPREMYKVVNASGILPIKPAKPNYQITNSIFSMNFITTDEELFAKDATYELFFIDAIGHVLNERQIVEIKNGKLSTERILFNLNTRDDSGGQYELMIQESGQDDYEVLGRLPFAANLAFAGTSNFDFEL